ncbi:hypothetical protein B0H63DRAFT_476736 [Podospora didyma]|uniref:Methyltransferase type 12 domain-containing protein n=1 Tax=Podospora didyma TaxID=330526 RepID=A0AAE0NHX4_9PEZI|nr:hypothetical protein B0H63DRAFT_476736 [Podospora didyma]
MSPSQKIPEQIAAAAKANAATYLATIPPGIRDLARSILEEYSGIAPEDVDAHIYYIRDKAWAIFPYGCVGSFSFLNLQPTTQDARFQSVAARLQAPGSAETFLDVGCCLGTVIRHLVADLGVSSDRLYGTDLQPHFLDLGYELFRDRDPGKSRATFVAGDMLRDGNDNDAGGLDHQLAGKIDVIYAAFFFHLFERGDQLRAAKRMVKFLRPRNPDAMIFGQNGGPRIPGWEKYVLDEEAWRDLWDEVGEATGTAWRTEMETTEDSKERIMVRFGVYRVVV